MFWIFILDRVNVEKDNIYPVFIPLHERRSMCTEE